MNKSSLAIHEVKLLVQSCPSFCNSSGVGEHAHGSLDLGKITPGYYSGGLVVDPNLEPCRTPVHELDGTLGLDGGDGSIDILWDNISTVKKAAGHILA